MRSLFSTPLVRRTMAVGVLATTLVAFQPARADQVLQTNNASLSSYMYSGATRIQGVRPRAEQRAVGLDGAQRAIGALPWALAGNPFQALQGGESIGAVRLAPGAYSPTDLDLDLPATIPWRVGRTFNSRQETSNASSFASNGYQGRNWFQISQPELRFHDADSNPATEQAADLLYFVFGADRYIEFKRTADSAATFRAVNGAAGIFKREAGSPDIYTYTDQFGNRTSFFGGNTASGKADWQLWKFVDPAGNAAYVGDASSASSAVSSGFNADGTIALAYDSSGRRFCYEYTTIDSVSRLTRVTAETDDGGGWTGCGSEILVGMVEYAYYQTGDNTHGDNGNLKLVTVVTPLSDQVQTLTKRRYYRYYKGEFNAETNPGYPYSVKMMLGYEGTRRADWDPDSTLNSSFEPDTDATLKPYADVYLTYDTARRVASVYFDGECGCSGGINGEHRLAYETNPAFAGGTAAYDTAWYLRVVIQPPAGGAWTTQYLDEVGQGLSMVTTDGDPAGTAPAPSKWVAQVVRNAAGQVTEIHTPANATGYTHNTSGSPDGAITTSSTVGLVHYYQRVASGDLTGFVEGIRRQAGSASLSTTSTFVSWTQYSTRALNIASGVNVTRPMVTATRAYHTATTNYATDYDETVNSHDWWEPSVDTDVLYITLKKLTVAAPAVDTGKNGSGVATSTKRHYRKDGTTIFTESALGIVTYTEVAGGHVATVIEDADTDTGTTYPSGEHPNTNFGIASSTAGFHRTTTNTYDPQGRFAGSTLPGGRVTLRWYAKLEGERLVTFNIPRVASYHGPAQYTITNQTGNIEECFVVAIDEKGTDAPTYWLSTAVENLYADPPADPIVAFTTIPGERELTRFTSSIYGKTGRRLESRRVFHQLPASMSSGDTVGKYDAWAVAYDNLGRTIRTVGPSGTIGRSTYDVLGRVTARKMGTDDTGEAGSTMAGTNNMVTTEAFAYDGGSDGGNSHLTLHTRYVENGATNQRQTSYLYDFAGRRLHIINPLAPHTVVKYDNRDRPVAAALFSSSSGLTASTDPVSTTTNRVALSQRFYDERGQVWKIQNHEIAQTTGADADNLQTLNWYDPDSRTIKTDGDQLVKLRYDGLGRLFQAFNLATDDDATYSDVYDASTKHASVAGDKVLEEQQFGYNGVKHEVLVRASIERLHDDTSTVGALDTTYETGDGLPLKFTAADVKGRIQIIATWYDTLDRPVTNALYGTFSATGNADTFDRSGLLEPTASDAGPTTQIVTRTVYNDDGTVKDRIDANGRATRFEYDRAGRNVATIANYTGASAPIATTARDTDIYTRFVYTNGLRTKMWSDTDGDGVEDTDDSVTEYVYGTTSGTPGSGSPVQSILATGHLLRDVIYPPQTSGQSAADRTVTTAYNAAGDIVWQRDQAGNVIQTDLDTRGRETHRRITTLASGFDGAVRRVSRTYLSRGLLDKVNQYDSASVGSGAVLDSVKHSYDGWGNITELDQDVDSEVGSALSGRDPFAASYIYAKSTTGRNSIRVSGMRLPGTTSVDFTYLSSSGRLDDAASRVSRVSTSVGAAAAVPVVQYEYLGIASLCGADLLGAQARSNFFDGASGGNPYPDLDRFNRIEDSRWTSYRGTSGGTREFYSVDVAYDAASNITSVTDTIHKSSAGNRNFDVLYTLDEINRVVRAEEGTLTSGAISNRSRDERWLDSSGNLGLSQTENWLRRRLDLNGDGAFAAANELDETNVFSLANELKTRDTDSNGTVNYTLAYDKVGNMTDDGKSYTYVYDPMGRLRQVKNRADSSIAAEYRYNGLSFRIAWHYDADADKDVDANDPWYYFCHDTSGHAVATFRAADADPKEVFVFHNAGPDGKGGASLLDAVIHSDRDVSTKWHLAADDKRETRNYICNNWRGDASVVLSESGKLLEWIKYSAYGVPFALPVGDTDSDSDWDLTDKNAITAGGTYDVRKDPELDGDMDAADIVHANSVIGTYQTLGRGILSSSGVGNRRGFASYDYDPTFEGTGASGRHLYHVRARLYDADAGRWCLRDPIGYVDGPSLYSYVGNQPVTHTDPFGLLAFPMMPSWCLIAPLLPKTYSDCQNQSLFPTRSSCESCCGFVLGLAKNPGMGDLRAYEGCMVSCRNPRNWGSCSTGDNRGNCWDYATYCPQDPNAPNGNQPPGVKDWIKNNPCAGCPPCSLIMAGITSCFPDATQPNASGDCPPGFYKVHVSTEVVVVVTIDRRTNQILSICNKCNDVHYARQDLDGTWREKRGCQPAQVCPPGNLHPGYTSCGIICLPYPI